MLTEKTVIMMNSIMSIIMTMEMTRSTLTEAEETRSSEGDDQNGP